MCVIEYIHFLHLLNSSYVTVLKRTIIIQIHSYIVKIKNFVFIKTMFKKVKTQITYWEEILGIHIYTHTSIYVTEKSFISKVCTNS